MTNTPLYPLYPTPSPPPPPKRGPGKMLSATVVGLLLVIGGGVAYIGTQQHKAASTASVPSAVPSTVAPDPVVTPTAPDPVVPSDPDQSYVDFVTGSDADLLGVTPSTLTDVGHAICRVLKTGYTYDEVLAVTATSGVTVTDIHALATGAVMYYCPQFASDIP